MANWFLKTQPIYYLPKPTHFPPLVQHALYFTQF